jgi:hypothetical protein
MTIDAAERERTLDEFRDLIIDLSDGVAVLRDDRVAAARARLDHGIHPSPSALAHSMVARLLRDRLR